MLARFWARFLLWFCGIKVYCKNPKHLPKKGSFVLLFNHRSYVDILVLFASTHRPIYFGAKKELFAIPLWGWLISLAGQIPIHRENVRQVHKVFYSLKSRVKTGDGFAMAAEGGTKKQAHLSPFKTGPFLLAFIYGLPVVPVVISGARECMPKGSYLCNPYTLKTVVKVEFLPAQDTQHLSKTQIPVLKKQLHQKMSQLSQSESAI